MSPLPRVDAGLSLAPLVALPPASAPPSRQHRTWTPSDTDWISIYSRVLDEKPSRCQPYTWDPTLTGCWPSSPNRSGSREKSLS